MLLNFEYETKLRVGFIGAGEHAVRNILPSFQYAPLELAALADEDTERGLAVARMFGARHFYPNYEAMLAKEKLDGVLIVVPPDEKGKPRYVQLGKATLAAGFHTWVDAPPCWEANDIMHWTKPAMDTHKYLVTGFRKMFAPAYLQVEKIKQSPAFGKVCSYSMRYPVALVPQDKRNDPKAVAPLFEAVHPMSVVLRLFGEPQYYSFIRTDVDGPGDIIVSFTYRNGLIGTLHLTGNQAATSPLERLEVVGTGANVVVENGVRLTYYRAGGTRGEGEPGRIASFIGPDDTAPITWEPDFSLGQLYNKQLFLQGYVGCLQYFAEMNLAKTPPRYGNMVDTANIMGFIDDLRTGKEREWLPVNG
jgi:predicted dehydrogenase